MRSWWLMWDMSNQVKHSPLACHLLTNVKVEEVFSSLSRLSFKSFTHLPTHKHFTVNLSLNFLNISLFPFPCYLQNRKKLCCWLVISPGLSILSAAAAAGNTIIPTSSTSSTSSSSSSSVHLLGLAASLSGSGNGPPQASPQTPTYVNL